MSWSVWTVPTTVDTQVDVRLFRHRGDARRRDRNDRPTAEDRSPTLLRPGQVTYGPYAVSMVGSTCSANQETGTQERGSQMIADVEIKPRPVEDVT
jgi:hypothetical protein